jgi:hypothetical protein
MKLPGTSIKSFFDNMAFNIRPNVEYKPIQNFTGRLQKNSYHLLAHPDVLKNHKENEFQ